jgi:hypothetical protein
MENQAPDYHLVHWLHLPEQRLALEFTDQGWALVEACAYLGDINDPQDLVVFMLGRIINSCLDDVPESTPELPVQWQRPGDSAVATISFPADALEAVSGVCRLTLKELKSAIQESVEQSLLQVYSHHSTHRKLH